ncbi:hypothetical protein [Ignatzschineria cameli]|uniref:hypothetical protein n=1 Tax=Ignatzschineria cameli TaxID=2182793 RepID=UPI000D608F01|nr:hypothetical protein [Ignatzschineria cameli]PWD83881.1 hypothetical protein DC080_07470 [Ignatzschineria cameli]
MTHNCNSYKPLDFKKMSRLQIMAYFENLGFQDVLGHKLTMSQDFIDLVEFASQKSNELEEHNDL